MGAELPGGPAYTWAKPSQENPLLGEQRPPGDRSQAGWRGAESHPRATLAAEAGQAYRRGTEPMVSDRPVTCLPGARQHQAPHPSPFQNLGTYRGSLSALRAPAPGTGLGARVSPRAGRLATGLERGSARGLGAEHGHAPAPRRLAALRRLPVPHRRGEPAPDTQTPIRRLLQPAPWSPGGPSGGPGRRRHEWAHRDRRGGRRDPTTAVDSASAAVFQS